jgi:hypothetical protein
LQLRSALALAASVRGFDNRRQLNLIASIKATTEACPGESGASVSALLVEQLEKLMVHAGWAVHTATSQGTTAEESDLLSVEQLKSAYPQLGLRKIVHVDLAETLVLVANPDAVFDACGGNAAVCDVGTVNSGAFLRTSSQSLQWRRLWNRVLSHMSGTQDSFGHTTAGHDIPEWLRRYEYVIQI